MQLDRSVADHLTVGALGEAGILKVLDRAYRQLTDHQDASSTDLVGPGDDAAIIPAPGGKFVIATDAMNEGHHFLRRWPSGVADTGYSTGWKLAAQNLSDMNAMGADPSAVSVSLAMPKTTPVAWVANFGRGIANACRFLGAQQTVISGGDLTRADTIATAITATASLPGPAVLRTAGSDVEGFLLIHRGNVGTSGAGLAIAAAKEIRRLSRPELRAVRLFLRPRPPLGEGPKVAGKVAAMMDVSDSILTDADRLATANGLYAHIDEDWVQRAAQPLASIGPRFGIDPTTWVLTGGEDYGLLGVLDPDRQVPAGWDVIGHLTAVPQDRPEITGWDHF